MPPQMQKAGRSLEGTLEIVIGETGVVEAAMMKVPFSPLYDPLAIAAAVEWRYKPATVAGVPVKYRKVVQIAFRR